MISSLAHAADVAWWCKAGPHLIANGDHGFDKNTQNQPTDGWTKRFAD